MARKQGMTDRQEREKRAEEYEHKVYVHAIDASSSCDENEIPEDIKNNKHLKMTQEQIERVIKNKSKVIEYGKHKRYKIINPKSKGKGTTNKKS